MKNIRLLFILLCIVLLSTSRIFAQLPQKLSYQGLLLVTANDPYVDSSYAITFQLYDAFSGGNSVWTETQSLSTKNGVFDAILGSIQPLNIPFDRQYWLGITVSGNPEFTPRVELVASPYSFKSQISNLSQGLTANATGAVLSLNGLAGNLFLKGSPGLTINNQGDTLSLSLAPSLGPSRSPDSSIDININGSFTELQLADSAVKSKNIKDAAITSSKILDRSILASKLAQMGASVGQILKWDGTNWVSSNDIGEVYTAGSGISIQNGIITNTGDRDSTNDIVIGSNAGGDLTGTYPNPTIADGKITNNKIANGVITADKFNQMGATNGQILKWNGTRWVPSNDIGKVYNAGAGIAISNDSIINTGDVNPNDDITFGSNAGGDLTGTYPNPSIGNNKVTRDKIVDAAITSSKINQMGATSGQVLKWNGSSWIPSADIERSYFPGQGIIIRNDTIFSIGDRDTSDDITINRITIKGEVLGKFDSLYIKDGIISTIKLKDRAVTGDKINQMGATTGQILKWNGTTWIASNDSTGKIYKSGRGIAISNDTIINTGDNDSTNDVTISRITTNGEVLGKFDSLYIKDGVVSTVKLKDRAVTGDKINQMGASTGQILKWNGTTWVASNDSTGKIYKSGRGIAISNDTIINTGDNDSTNDVTISRITTNGEVLGKFDSLYIKDGVVSTVKLKDRAVTGDKINQMGATTGQILKWNGTTWVASNDSTGKLYKSGRGIAISNDTIINTGDNDSTNDVTITRITTNGEVLGKFDSLYIKDGIVSTVKLKDSSVTTAKIKDRAVTGDKINQMSASTGQILKWNGTTWVASNDSTGKIYKSGRGIAISNDTIINTGDIDSTNDVTITRITTNGEVLGKFDSLYIKDGIISTIKLKDRAVTGDKINQMSATTGQVLKWNGTTWVASNDSTGKIYKAGRGIAISNDTIINTGDNDSTNDVTISRITTNGEVLGKFDSLYIKDGVVSTVKLRDRAVTGDKINQMSATTGQVLKWNGTTWVASNDSTGKIYKAGTGIAISNDTIINTGDIDSTNDVTITRITTNGEVLGKFDSLYIKDGIVSTVKLKDSSVTTVKLRDRAVTGDKINQMSATTGQILKWNGTTWIASNDSTGKIYKAGTGIAISNDTIINTGDNDSTNDVTITRITTNGEVLGKFDSLYIKDGIVSTVKLKDRAVTGDKINQMSATTGQILKWNGTTWIASNDSTGKIYKAGTGIAISNDTIINTGDNDSTNDVTISRITTNGEVLGKFDSLYIKDGVVSTVKLKDSSVTTAKIKDRAVTGDKINQMSATTGQVLKWNGTTWIASNDSTGKIYKAGTGIAISNDTIINTGDIDSTNDVTITRITTNGEVLGKFDSLYIKDGVVSTVKLKDRAVTGDKINQMSATTGQILKWNGTTWIASNDSTGKIYKAGTGIAISNDTIINTGDNDSTNDVTITRITTNGEVLGKFDSLYIKDGVVSTVKLRDRAVTGDKINQMSATTGQVLKWNGTTWVASNDSTGKIYKAGTGIAISNDTIINTGDNDSTNDVTITRITTNGEVLGKFDSLYIKDGVVSTVKLKDSSVTTAKIKDRAVTGDKINQMSATTGQVLKWNGTTWVASNDSTGKIYKAGTGIAISNDTIINTGDIDSTNDVTITRITTNGEVLGKFDSLYIKDGVVSTVKLRDRAVTGDKINQMSATTGQVLKWNGTTWIASNDSTGKIYKAGTGIAISNDTIINTGDNDSTNDVTITRITTNGEVLGKFDSLYIKDGVVSTVKLRDRAVTGDKINQMSATTGQILKWNGTTWIASNDSTGKIYKAGTGIAISNDTIINTGDNDSTNDVTITRITTNGEVLGKFDSLYIKDGVVSTVKLKDRAVTGDKINQMSATTGQVLKWNGTTWVASNDSTGKIYKAGTGIAISNDTIINTGDNDSTNDVTITRITTNGEVLGKFDSLYIKDGVVSTVKLRDRAVTGDKINQMSATTGQVLKWNGTTWVASNDSTGKIYKAGTGIAISNDTIINTGDNDSTNDVTITRITTNGEVLGKFDSLYIKDGVVSTVKLKDSSVTTAKIKDRAVTGDKINQMSATTGQVLKWNGTTWVASNDSTGKIYKAGTGIAISNDTIINTGDNDSTNDVTITRITTNGEVLGKFDSLYIKDGVVSTVKLRDRAVTGDKINQMSATTGQILKWNGTTWIASNDSTGKIYKAGTGIAISNDTIINTGDNDSTNDVTITRITTNGEVLGKFDSLYIKDGVVSTVKLRDRAVTGDKINQMSATTGQILKWNGTTWIASNDSTGKIYKAGTGIAISNDTIINTGDNDSTNDVTITRITTNGEVLGKFDSLYIKDGVVSTVKLKDRAVTGDKINQMSATTGQVLKWNGTTWVASNDSTGKIYKAGTGIAISNDTIINTGDNDSTNDVTITRITTNGEVLGKFDSLYIKDGVVSTVKLRDRAVTGDKINQMSATTGQVLKWNGTTWVASNDSTGKIYKAGTGIAISNDTIINTGDIDSTNDVTITRITTNGEVLGKFDSLYIKDGVVSTVKLKDSSVTTAKIKDRAVTGDKINQMSATTGQVLKWNGTTWVASNDSTGKIYKAGTGIAISNDTIINTGDNDSTNDVTITRITTNGEVLGKFDSLYIKDGVVSTVKLRDRAVTGDKINQMSATTGQILKWNGTTWIASNDSTGKIYKAGTGIAISNDTIINTGDNDSTNDVTITRITTNGEVLGKFDSLYIKDGVVSTVKLKDSSVTTAKIKDRAVTGDKINQMSATTGQVLKWNGTTWVASNDSTGKIYKAGTGIAISNDTIINTGDIDSTNDVTITRITTNGEVLGKFDSLYIKDGVVSTVKLRDRAVTGDKINQMSATTGQVLKWNGTTWIASNDSTGKIYKAGTGIAISNDTIINTGDNDSTNDVTITRITTNGEVLGKFDSLYIKDGVVSTVKLRDSSVTTAKIKDRAVTTAKLADSAVTAAKLSNMGASTGQILKWNGTTWVASNDSVRIYKSGNGITISNDTIINTGDIDSTNDVTITRITTNGEVLGKFDSLYIKDGVVSTVKLRDSSVTTAKIKDRAVTTAKLADSAVTAAKLSNMGASTGQILKWNGTTWVASNDSVRIYKSGNGIAISNDTIINTGDIDSTNDVTITRITTNGEVLGKFDSLYIKDGVVSTIKLKDSAVTTAKIKDRAVTGDKINQMSATTGQVLKWNGTTWVASNDSVRIYKSGNGITISNDTIINTGDIDSTNDVTITRITTNGEVLGKFDSLYIKDGVVSTVKLRDSSVTTAKIKDRAVTTAKLADSAVTAAKLSNMGASTGQILKWNGTTWVASNDSVRIYKSGNGITISNDTIINTGDIDSTNDVTITRITTNGEVLGKFDSLYIKDGVVSTVKLRDSSVTTAKIKDRAVTTAKLADSAVTAAKLSNMGASTGQILKWNGTTWVASNDSVRIYKSGNGITISNDTIINTGDIDSTNDVTITRITTNGEVLGKFDSLYIKDGIVSTVKLRDSSVTTAKIKDRAVTTAKLADSAVTAAKLSNMGASTGQILKWNGTTWVASNDSVRIYKSGNGITISNDTIINTGDIDSTNDVTITRITTNGEVLGKFDSLYIKDGVVSTVKLRDSSVTTAKIKDRAVTTAKLADSAVTAAKLSNMGASTGQILKWNGTTWVASNDSVRIYKSGNGITISNDTIINTGDIDSTNDVTITRITTNGEVLGKFDSLYIKDGIVSTVKLRDSSVTTAKIKDRAVTTAKLADSAVTAAKLSNMGASTGQILKWDGTTWVASNDSVRIYKAGNGIAISNDSISLSEFESTRNKTGVNSTVAAHRLQSKFTGESNIDMVISPKGTGALLAQLPDGTTTGGDKRGNYAVDLQMERGSSAQIASGINSSITGGKGNRALGALSIISGGRVNYIVDSLSVIVGGDSNFVSGKRAFVGGGQKDSATANFAVVVGGDRNSASGSWSAIGGGIVNKTSNWYTTIAGGANNTAYGEGSSIFGGIEMNLDANADNSFGFNGNLLNGTTGFYERTMTISAPRTGVFNNVDLWITNNDNTPKTLRFYERYNVQGAFPIAGTNYVGFKAPNTIAADVTWTLPSADGTANQVLKTNGAGILSWSVDIGTNYLGTNGITVSNDTIRFSDFLSSRNKTGVNSSKAVHSLTPYFSGETNFDIALVPGGNGAVLADIPDNLTSGGDKRGNFAVDLQMARVTKTQIAKGVYSIISGGYSNTAYSDYSTISGGNNNFAEGDYSVVSGGSNNQPYGIYSTVGGGFSNSTDGVISTVAGGTYNKAGDTSVVAGGVNNWAMGNSSGILGGKDNYIEADLVGSYSAVLGGLNNDIYGSSSSIVGGSNNIIVSDFSTILGGSNNKDSSDFSTILGGRKLTFTANADRSIGFNASNSAGTKQLIIDDPNVAVFNNVDFWLANNDNTTRMLRFYEKFNDPTNNGLLTSVNFVALRSADVLLTNLVFTLPSTYGTANQVLKTDGSGVLSWTSLASGGLNFFTEAKDSTGINTSRPIYSLRPNGSETNIDVAFRPIGEGGFAVNVANGTSSGGNKRGKNSIDLQSKRSNSAYISSGDMSVIAGGEDNKADSTWTVIAGGKSNSVTKIYGAILGGYLNNIQSEYSSILGGKSNSITANFSTIGGGDQNTVSGGWSVISGGVNNTATANYSTISGGRENKATNIYASIGGGYFNDSTGSASTISGGYVNNAPGEYASITGGRSNNVRSDYSTILGGRGFTFESSAARSIGYNANNTANTRDISIVASNTAVLNNVDMWLTNNDNTPRDLRFYEQYNTAGDFPNGSNYVALKAANNIAANVTWTLPPADGTVNQVLKTNGAGTLSWANNASSAGLQYFTESQDIAAPNATIPVHMFKASDALYTDIDAAFSPKGKGALLAISPNNTITGGNKRGEYAVDFQRIRGNPNEVATGNYSAILNGENNRISNDGHHSSISGGSDNTITGSYSTIGGGQSNSNAGSQSSIVGGNGNTISSSASNATIAGGSNHTVSGYNATVSGGDDNNVTADYGSISGGTDNIVAGESGSVMGGEFNTNNGDHSSILGGSSMTFTTAADNSIGYNGGTNALALKISEPNVAVFNDVNFWLTNNDNVARELRFYGASTFGKFDFPNEAGDISYYSAFKAGTQTSNITYTLPTSLPTESGKPLVTATDGTLSWGTSTINAQNINVDCPNLNANGGSANVDITVTGAVVGGTVTISPRADLEDGLIIAYSRVNAANTVRVRFVNATNAALNPAAVNIDITVIQP